jgi:nitrite reductase/ring-hydroxylating ferredoxin subunit
MGLFDEKTKRYFLAATTKEFVDTFHGQTQVVNSFDFGSVLFILDGNSIRAVAAKCPHQGKPMKGCWIEENHVICPWHQYRFSLETGRGHGLHLETYVIVETEQGVFLERRYFGLW